MKKALIIAFVISVLLLVFCAAVCIIGMQNDIVDLPQKESFEDTYQENFIQNYVEDTESTIIIQPDIVADNEQVTQETEESDIVDQEEIILIQYFTEEEVEMLAKILWTECGAVESDTEKACVAWTVVNHVDAGYADTIAEAITIPYHFAWDENAPVVEELYNLAKDVLERWNLEKNGEHNVGRVLPSDYLFFVGDGVRNYFRNAYNGNYVIWDYSLPSPYID